MENAPVKYALFVVPIMLVPNLCVLPFIAQFCKRFAPHSNVGRWQVACFALPFWAVPKLFTSHLAESDPDKARTLWWRLFVLIGFLQLLFVAIGVVVELA